MARSQRKQGQRPLKLAIPYLADLIRRPGEDGVEAAEPKYRSASPLVGPGAGSGSPAAVGGKSCESRPLADVLRAGAWMTALRPPADSSDVGQRPEGGNLSGSRCQGCATAMGLLSRHSPAPERRRATRR